MGARWHTGCGSGGQRDRKDGLQLTDRHGRASVVHDPHAHLPRRLEVDGDIVDVHALRGRQAQPSSGELEDPSLAE